MSAKTGILVASALLLPLGLWLSCAGVDLDRSIAVEPGGKLKVAMTLGSGFSFDKGSLTVSSHQRPEVRVVVDTSGWGEYAVAVDIREVKNGVRVDGRVDGLLHWLFGGPTVDLQVWVPPNYSVDASIEDGPLLIEDVIGPITAKIDASELTLRRAEGNVELVAEGPILVEDVEGNLDLEADGGNVDVSGVRGDLRVRSGRGDVQLSSVTGRVEVSTSRGRVRAEDLDGSARVTSERGGIEIEGMEGDLEVETDRGRIEVAGLEGRILAKSGRGGIDVRFVTDPSGLIETARGSIEIQVPEAAAFDLDASTARGRVELDSDLEFAHRPSAKQLGPGHDPAAAYADVGRQIAAEVTTRVHENVQRGLETGDWNFDWDFEFDFERRLNEAGSKQPSEPQAEQNDRANPWHHHSWGWKDWEARDGKRLGGRSVHIQGTVNGGGAPLRLRTERGSIEIDDD